MSEDKGSFGSTDLNKEESIMFGFSKSKEKNSENKRKIEKLYEKYNRLMYVVVYNILKNQDRKSTRLNSSHRSQSRMPSSA